VAEDLSSREMAAWRPFVTAATQVIGALDAEMKANFGISHFDHALLLMLLGRPRRRARMVDLARSAGVDPSNITYRVRRLERLGLVDRLPDPEDRRVSYAHITRRGVALLRDAWPMHREGIRRHFLDHVRHDQLPILAEVFTSILGVQQPAEPVNWEGAEGRQGWPR
jgi:DNA-binding MarR family transcriptional regulator